MKKFLAAVLSIIFIVLSFSGCFDSKEPPKESSTASKYELSFYLKAGEKGDYGNYITYNKGTEFEEKFYAYYVPNGTYTVTNKGKYMTQVNVYSDETHKVDGWDEPVDCKVYLLNVDESKEIIVPEGYHIELTEPTYVLMQK